MKSDPSLGAAESIVLQDINSEQAVSSESNGKTTSLLAPVADAKAGTVEKTKNHSSNHGSKQNGYAPALEKIPPKSKKRKMRKIRLRQKCPNGKDAHFIFLIIVNLTKKIRRYWLLGRVRLFYVQHHRRWYHIFFWFSTS